MLNVELSKIIDLCWEHYVRFRDANDSILVSHSIPILWFGDYKEYSKSALKVVTIAINPSNDEFKLGKKEKYSFGRFKKGAMLFDKNKLIDQEKELFCETLNEYYHDTPYKLWFSRMEIPINCINTTYGGQLKDDNCENTAIHLDLCPLATDKKWSDVAEESRKHLQKEGLDILSQFLKVLKPDIFVSSLSEEKLKTLFGFNAKDDWVNEYRMGRNFIRTYKSGEEYGGKWVINGLNNKGTPFGMSKVFISESIREWRNSNGIIL